MPCERDGCGHPLAVHDPCSICGCPGYLPEDRKSRAAMLTDIYDEPHRQPPATRAARSAWLRELHEKEQRRLGRLS